MEGADFPPKTVSTVTSRTVENKNSNRAKAFMTVFHPSTQKGKIKTMTKATTTTLLYLLPTLRLSVGKWVFGWNGGNAYAP